MTFWKYKLPIVRYTILKYFRIKIIRLRYFVLILLVFLSKNTLSQVGGTEIYQFLNISSSARQVALGGEVLTLRDDVNQPIWNPAVINSELDNQLSANYSNYFAGISIGSVSFAKLFSRRFGTLHANITYLNYGDLISADEEGNELGTFNANDVALSLGYAVNLPWTNFYFGTNLRFINSNIANFNSTGISADVSLLYYSPYKPYVFTAVLRNIGVQLSTFDGIREQIPMRIALGASYQLEYVPLRWYLTINNLQQWDLSEPNPSEAQIDLEGNIINQKIGFFNNALRKSENG